MKKHKILTGGILVTMMIGLIAISAIAATISKTYINYVGNSNAKAIQTAKDLTVSRWKSEFVSRIEITPVPINVIGRTWWRVREYCWPNWTQNFEYSGDFDMNDFDYYKTKVVIKQPCTGDRFGKSLGGHDFNDNYSPQWRPTQETNYQLVP